MFCLCFKKMDNFICEQYSHLSSILAKKFEEIMAKNVCETANLRQIEVFKEGKC